MKTSVKSVRLDRETVRDIEQIRRRNHRTFSSLAGELLAEAAKMRRCPGILFADGPSGRRARVEGCGVEVWEIIASYQALDQDDRRLSKAYSWLDDRQLLAALGYARAYPDEVEQLIAENKSIDAEAVSRQLPFARRAGR